MDISVLISWKTRYKHVAWSVGYCPFCQQLEPLRVENAIEVTSIWFIPVSRNVTGAVTFCDFCRRPVLSPTSAQGIELSKWSPSDGVEALLSKLAPSQAPQIPEANSISRLHSLLASAQEASSINNIDISFGISTGIILGICIGVSAGFYLFDNAIVHTQLDRFGFVFASALAGVVTGAVVGATLHAIVKRGRSALKMIETACDNYPIDTTKLEELSSTYNRIVRAAVRAVRDSALPNKRLNRS